MIPAIAVMIGAYIITRMFEVMAKVDSHAVTKTFAAITVVISMVSIVVVLIAGSHTPELRPY